MFKLRITGDLGFEVWKDIPGYEGLYQASTYGRVRSTQYKGKKRLKILKTNPCNGYEYAHLFKNKIKNCFVHRLVFTNKIFNFFLHRIYSP